MRQLLEQVEHDARLHAASLEAAGKLPAGFTTRHHPLTRLELFELRRLKTAAAIALDVDAYVELARGRPVTGSRIKPRALQHHRQQLAHGR